MKKYLFPIVLTIPLVLSACGESDYSEEAQEACHQDTIDKAKYPGAAEIVKTHIEVDEDDGEVHVSGIADFPNGFGTPVRHTYLCTASVVDGDITVENNTVMEGEYLDSDFFNE
jgi:hypothetical protein